MSLPTQFRKLNLVSDKWKGTVSSLQERKSLGKPVQTYGKGQWVFCVWKGSDKVKRKTLSGLGSGQFDVDVNFGSLHANHGEPSLDSITKNCPQNKQMQTETIRCGKKRNPLLDELNSWLRDKQIAGKGQTLHEGAWNKMLAFNNLQCYTCRILKVFYVSPALHLHSCIHSSIKMVVRRGCL